MAWVISDKSIRSSYEILDELYGFNYDKEESAIYQNVETNIKKINTEVISSNIQFVFDSLIELLKVSGKNFNNLIFESQQPRISRYFQIVFYSLYELLISQNKQISDKKALIAALDKAGDKVIKLSAGGGRWSAKEKQTQTDAFVGVISRNFIDSDNNDPARSQWITKFENILMQSSTEQTLYDFKVGLHNLDAAREFNNDLFNKVICTLTAMANTHKNAVGYCLIGVSDSADTTRRYKEIYGTEAIRYSNFDITGANGDASNYKKLSDEYFTKIVNLIKTQPITERDKDNLLRNISLIKYFEKEVILLKIESDSKPSIYNGKYFVRHGSNLSEVPAENFADLFKRFQ